MESLRFLYLQYNYLEGGITREIQDMPKMLVMDVSHNLMVTGEFPKEMIPSWPEVEYIAIMNTSMLGYIASLCIDVPFCWKYMFDTHPDLTWAVEGGIPDIV